MHELSDHAALNISGFDVVKRNLTSGDGLVDEVIKVRIRDQRPWTEMACKILGILTEKHEHTHTHFDGLALRLKQGEQRWAKYATEHAIEAEVVDRG